MPSLSNHLRRGRDIYAAAPVWLQNAAVTTYGLAWKWQRYGGRFHEGAQACVSREEFSRDEWRDYQTGQLRRLVTHAIATVPYYAEAFARAGLTPRDCANVNADDLSRLPLLDKDTVRRRSRDLISSAVNPRRLHTSETSGTTGTPLTVSFSLDSQRAWAAVWEARGRRWAGVTHRTSRAMIGGRRVVPWPHSPPPYWRYNWAERQIYLSAYHVSPATARHYVKALNEFQPGYLIGFGSSYFLLAQIMQDQGRTLERPPLALLTSGEVVTADMRTTMQAAYGCPVFDSYGSAEACCLACECQFQRMHVSPDAGIIEVVGADGRPVADGEAGEIVATGLLNHAQPLIRYRMGDWGRLSHEPCRCGRQMPILDEVQGRLHDAVVMADGCRVSRVDGIILGVASVREGQIIQEGLTAFRIKVVADEGFGDEERAVIRARCRERLGDVQVRVDVVERIERTAGGKFKAVVSELPQGQSQMVGG